MDGGEATWCVYSTSHPTHKNVDLFDVGKFIWVVMWRYLPTIAIGKDCTLCVLGVQHEVLYRTKYNYKVSNFGEHFQIRVRCRVRVKVRIRRLGLESRFI